MVTCCTRGRDLSVRDYILGLIRMTVICIPTNTSVFGGLLIKSIEWYKSTDKYF